MKDPPQKKNKTEDMHDNLQTGPPVCIYIYIHVVGGVRQRILAPDSRLLFIPMYTLVLK